jgi:hypothetical protein
LFGNASKLTRSLSKTKGNAKTGIPSKHLENGVGSDLGALLSAIDDTRAGDLRTDGLVLPMWPLPAGFANRAILLMRTIPTRRLHG